MSWKGVTRIIESPTGPAQDSLKNPTMACTINNQILYIYFWDKKKAFEAKHSTHTKLMSRRGVRVPSH